MVKGRQRGARSADQGWGVRWIPRLSPSRPLFQRRLEAIAACGVRQRPRRVEYQVIVIDLGREQGVALLSRPEYQQDHIDRAHRWSLLRAGCPASLRMAAV